MPKEDCKYWDKCYQKNEYHLQKYNHPQKKDEGTKDEKEDGTQQKSEAPKHKLSNDEEMDVVTTSTSKRVEENKSDDDADHWLPKREKHDISELRSEALSNIAGKNYMEILQKRIETSVQSEYNELLKSNEFLRHKFLVEMPPDFHDFWKFASELKKDASGEDVLKHFEKQFQLQLVGPFDYLAGRFDKATIREPGDYLRHWRFFYDPPEFQTIFVRNSTGVHYGYWRDVPQDKESLLIARNDASKDCEFEFVAGNAFDAFLYFLEKDFVGTPFTASVVASTKKGLQKYVENNGIDLKKVESLRKVRNAKVVAKTFHRAGIVVPLDAKSQVGYRPLIESDAELKKILKLFEKAGAGDDKDDVIRTAVIEKLQPIATAASIALDESDFGTSLELGIDLFCSGYIELHMLVQSMLVPAYTLLNRPQFIAISKAHMEKRSKHFNLSIFELDKK